MKNRLLQVNDQIWQLRQRVYRYPAYRTARFFTVLGIIFWTSSVQGARSLLKWSASLSGWVAADPQNRLKATIVFALSGCVMFWYRANRREHYGFLELGFATAIAWNALGARGASAEATFATLAGALYVFVRGLDNISQSLAPKGAAAFGRFLWRHFTFKGDPAESAVTEPATKSAGS